MYDVQGKPTGEKNGHGRMQQAVEEWTKSAQEDKISRLSKEIKSNIDAGGEINSEVKTDTEDIDKTRVFSKCEFINDNFTSPLPKDNEAKTVKPGDELDDVKADQEDYLKKLIVRFTISIFIALILVGISVVPNSLPSYINAGRFPIAYISLNLILLLITGIINFSTSFKGIVQLFTFRPDSDSIVSLSFYGALIGILYSLYSYTFLSMPPAGVSTTAIYASCAALGISFNLLGKVFYVARVKNNLGLLEKIETAYSAVSVKEDDADLLMPAFDGTASIVKIKKTDSLTGFIDKSYEASPSDRTSRVYAPLTLAAALVSTGLYALLRDAGGAVTVFCALCSISSPLLFELGVSIPFYRTCKRLVNHGSILTGCADVMKFGGADAIAADGSFIFSEKGTKIIGIKTFHKAKIEESLLYASSISEAGKSPLSSAFLDIFADVGIGKKLLKKVDRIIFEDNKGLYAVIENKDVLLGNRQLMHHHMVDTPSRDYEMRYAVNGRDVVYLAVDGHVCAIFIVEYGIDDDTCDELYRLNRYGVDVLVETSDPNITPQLLEEKSGLDSENITILDFREMKVLDKYETEDSAEAGIVIKDMAGYVESIISCIKLKGTLWANTVLQVILSSLGILFAVYLEFTGITVSSVLIIGYQLLCAVPVLLIGLLRRN
ncbi:MAG TPA: hypothetical protein VHO66_04775 [Ruminiclostridium sp.]|nr:hypothetical protein [Ruminiclostridium sp.]